MAMTMHRTGSSISILCFPIELVYHAQVRSFVINIASVLDEF